MEATPYQHYRFGPARLASRLPLPVLPTEAHDGGPAELVLDARPVRNQPAQVTAWRHHWPARDGSITLRSKNPEYQGDDLTLDAEQCVNLVVIGQVIDLVSRQFI